VSCGPDAGDCRGAETDANPTEPTMIFICRRRPGQRSGVMVLPGGGYTNLSMANEARALPKCC